MTDPPFPATIRHALDKQAGCGLTGDGNPARHLWKSHAT